MKTRLLPTLTAALALSAFAVSCTFNVFDPIDGPGGDAQLISAARAALDRGEFEKAVEYYQKLSNSGDIAKSEQAFTLLAKNNVGMGAFASAFGTGGSRAGAAITKIASGIGSGAGEATRIEIFQAFKIALTIDDASLRGLTRFLSATALIAETLAEGAANPAAVTTTDIAATPSSCPGVSCIANAACNRPSASTLTSGGGVFDLETATEASMKSSTNAPTLSLIHSAITEIEQGLNELGSSGNLGSSLTSFTDAFDPLLLVGEAPCYRAALLIQGIGSI